MRLVTAETLIRDQPGLTLMAPAELGIVCFRREWPGLDSDQAERAGLVLVAEQDVIRRWDSDRFFCVAVSGRYEVFIDGRLVRTLGSGGHFGELAAGSCA